MIPDRRLRYRRSETVTGGTAFAVTLAAILFAASIFTLLASTRSTLAATLTPTPRPSPTTRAHTTVTRTPIAHVQASASPLATPAARVTAPAASAPSADLVAKGRGLYTTFGCSGCHSLPAINAKGTFGPSHEHVATHAASRVVDPTYTGNAKTAEEYLSESIVSPDIYEAPEYRLFKYAMPAFKSLSSADVDALVAFLMQQK